MNAKRWKRWLLEGSMSFAITLVATLWLHSSFAYAYTLEQAQKGQAIYFQYCAKCHGDDARGQSAPSLVGAGIDQVYPTAEKLYDFVSKMMPQDNPGSLTPEEYWNVVAYILNLNGVQPDNDPLGPETAATVSLGAARQAMATTQQTARVTPQVGSLVLVGLLGLVLIAAGVAVVMRRRSKARGTE